MAEQRVVKVMMVGNSGVGKSLLANAILGRAAFVHKVSAHGVTTRVQSELVVKGDVCLAVYDMPGLIEADPEASRRNASCICEAFDDRPGTPTVILYVFGACVGGRISASDVEAWNAVKESLRITEASCKAVDGSDVALAFVINMVPDDVVQTYPVEVRGTLSTLCDGFGEVCLVPTMPRLARRDMASVEMTHCHALLWGALQRLVSHAVPIRLRPIELSQDKHKRAIEGIAELMRARQEQHRQELARIAEEHAAELERAVVDHR